MSTVFSYAAFEARRTAKSIAAAGIETVSEFTRRIWPKAEERARMKEAHKAGSEENVRIAVAAFRNTYTRGETLDMLTGIGGEVLADPRMPEENFQ